MPYHYSDKARESDPQALPDVDTTFHHGDNHWNRGWYWRAVGGYRHGSGPFDSEAEALADAREGVEP